MFFVILSLFVKTYYGMRWIVKRFKRPALQTFYMASWAFYTSFCAQSLFIIFFTWDVFNNAYRALTLTSMFLCFPFFAILTGYMQYVDKQNYSLNLIRKVHSEAKRQSKLMHEQDR